MKLCALSEQVNTARRNWFLVRLSLARREECVIQLQTTCLTLVNAQVVGKVCVSFFHFCATCIYRVLCMLNDLLKSHLSLFVHYFVGPRCSEDVDECRKSPCKNGARCTNSQGSYTCKCKPGYSGHNCQTDIDDCSPSEFFLLNINSLTWWKYIHNACTSKPVHVYKHSPCPLLSPLQTHAWMEALVWTKLGASHVIAVQVLQGCAVRRRWMNVPISPAITAPPAMITSTVLYASADQVLMDSCVNATSPNALTGGLRMQDVTHYYYYTKTYVDMCVNSHNTGFDHRQINQQLFLLFLSSFCLNNGTCIDGTNTFLCRCRHGFYGTFCEYEHNECNSQPCKNGGTCTDGLGTYHCTCPKGYNGQNCQVLWLCVCVVWVGYFVSG